MRLHRQHDMMDCGPACLRMVAEHYGRKYSLQELRNKSFINREGVSLYGISEAAESIGFRSIGVRTSFEKLTQEAPLPCILHWNQNHFVVLYKSKKGKHWIADPAGQKVILSKEELLNYWLSTSNNGSSEGVALLLEPTPDFYNKESQKVALKKNSLSYLFGYLKNYSKYILQLVIGLIVGSLIQLVFPFLTQSIVDIGINTRDLNFIYLVLAGQLILFFSRTSVEFIRQWILLHLSTRINVSIISDFLIKLMRLPLSFFDTKNIGDILQRINDHARIQQFLSSSSISILFSVFNVFIFGLVLLVYHVPIFSVFFAGSAIYLGYVVLFLKKRKELDYKKFNQMSSNQSSLIQLINGMTEIKLNSAEKIKRWDWERIQAKLFKVNIESTKLLQYQESGSLFFNEMKNIFITFLAAKAVIAGDMTLGMMLAVQYIIGQLNAPINELINFVRQWHDAKISLERIGEVHSMEDEENESASDSIQVNGSNTLRIAKLSYQYDGAGAVKALDDLTISIPEGKVTAIVGASGSGKTTLMKILLKIYPPTEGIVSLGGVPFDHLSAAQWRQRCGVVMQDGFIFSDTIANNIALSEEHPNKELVVNACKIANIHDHIEQLPLGYNTKIGSEGIGLSEGQKQRILIARAVYKNPDFLFFDEATSALDANNEKVITNNLADFFFGKTVLVIAHRLSTVKNADQIIVLQKGQIIEQGCHADLIESQGEYYRLVKNQLELGT